MKIAITGETGFLGYHLTQYFKYQLKYNVVELTRDYQSNINTIKDCDWLIHCAGVNKGLNLTTNNVSLATELVQLLNDNSVEINIAYASSIQEYLRNEYGLDKAEAGKILNAYCNQINKKFISYKLPNLFGPFGKPNYNSVVSTFCYNIANDNISQINDNIIDLCYVYDAISEMKLSDDIQNYTLTNISVSNLFIKLQNFHTDYSKGIIPKLYTKFDIQLFNTYRSFVNCKHEFTTYVDERGYLAELLKSKGSESQLFFSTTIPGVTRGNHFHFNKIERFCVLKGTANVSMRKLGTSEVISYIIEENKNTVIDMPILYAHNITNIGDSDLICVFWTNEIFNKEIPDTYYIQV